MFTLIELLVYNTYIDINPFRSTIRWQIRSEDGRFFVLLDKNKCDTYLDVNFIKNGILSEKQWKKSGRQADTLCNIMLVCRWHERCWFFIMKSFCHE